MAEILICGIQEILVQSITVSPTSTLDYTVTVTKDGCDDTDSVKVIVNPTTDSVTADAGVDEEICLDSSVTLTASGGDSYLWSTGETEASITVSPTETTTYTVTVSNGNSIAVDDVTVIVDQGCSALGNRAITEEFKVYPNPTNGMLHVELSGFSNELNISLVSMTGKIIYSEVISNYAFDKSLKRNINLRKFGKGIYYAKLSSSNYNEAKKVLVY